MKSRKFLIVLLIIVVVCFSISNQSAVSTIDDAAYVVAMGFDTGSDGKMKLSLQIAIPSAGSASSGDSSDSSQSSSSIVNTIECDTIYSGINLINSYISKKLNLSYCKVAVFSEEMASKGISNYISTLINDVEVRPSCHILISRCEAKYLLENSKPMLDNLSSKYYEMELSAEKNTGYTKAVTLMDFYSGYYDTFSQPYAILGSISDANSGNLQPQQFATSMDSQNVEKINDVSNVEAQSSSSVEKNIENLGLAVFSGDNFVGELSSAQTICHLMLRNEFKSAIVNIPSPLSDSDYISIYVAKVKTKNNVKIVNNSPYITCDVKISARVLSSSISSNYLTNENVEKIEDYANSYFKAHIEEYLYKTSIEFGSDITGFGKYAVRNFATWDKWQNYNWLENYRNSFFKVNVSTNVVSSYLIIGNNG